VNRMRERILIMGFGNPGRKDDGLGPALAQAIDEAGMPGVDADADYQLNIEDGASLVGYDAVVFADASLTAPAPFEWRRLSPASSISFTTHAVSPESVLAVCEDHFGPAPPAWALGIRGYEFDFGEGLSRRAVQNLESALDFLREVLESWKE